MLHGFQVVDGKKYYFDPVTGVVKTDWVKEAGKWHYYDKSGEASGEKLIAGKWYYFNPNSNNEMAIGKIDLGHKTVYYNEQGQMIYGEKLLDGEWYYFDETTGAMATGWTTHHNKRYYYDEEGHMSHGWFQVEGVWYYFDNVTGIYNPNWEREGDSYYYVVNGERYKGELRINNNWYYFDETTGAMATGWTTHHNKRYYYDGEGHMSHGWFQVEGVWYYFDNVTGVYDPNWEREGDFCYYLVNGERYKGELRINNQWYYFDEITGAMATGWTNHHGRKYYYNSNGQMQYGFQTINGNTYYFDNVYGNMKTGWQNINGSLYYFYLDGRMARNTTIDGKRIGADGRVQDYSVRMSMFSTVSTNNANGTYNMSRALCSFNQVVLNPGQTVSFFAVAGPCGQAQGYRPAGVVGGVGYGGGICQASTTLYGAGIRAGLTVVERRNHSVPSTYVPIGQDAMVNYGSSDLKLRNDFNFPVKIVTYVNGNTLYAEIWGNSVESFDSIQINSWRTGSNTAAAERVYYKNGKIVRREALPSSYYY